MSELSKITSDHLRRRAVVYVRQSSTTQVEHNRESTARQYQLAERAVALGWARDQVKVFDEDLGVSGSGLAERAGFARMTAEVSRLARNDADWYRLLDLCGVTHTLIGDADGIYHPGLFNDRLVLGLKGTMSEAELHVLRARLLGGMRNKAARGELHRGLPVGLVRGEADGEELLHPDESVIAAIRAVFERFAEMGSARRVWLWFRSQSLRFPLQSNTLEDVHWVTPTYTKIHQVLTNPFYAGSPSCKPSAGSPSGRRMAHRFTTSATVPSRPRCTAWCSSSRPASSRTPRPAPAVNYHGSLRTSSTPSSSATSTSHSTSPAASARPTRTIHGDVELAGDVRVG
jgi:DNA invertase Pin-like site-specific DNA recombinase